MWDDKLYYLVIDTTGYLYK